MTNLAAPLMALLMFAAPAAFAADSHDTGHTPAAQKKAAAVPHGAHDAGTHTPDPAFDEKNALKVSQSALGRTLDKQYRFASADGRQLSLGDYRGKPLVLSLIYTSCNHICPTTTKTIDKVTGTARKALGDDSFRVVTVGFDTVRDSPDAMRGFAREQGVDLKNWDFLSTDRATIERLTQELGFLYRSAPHGFDHLVQTTVIDAEGKIYRHVYGMTFDTPLLVEPLKELVFGRPVEASVLTHLGNRIKLFCTVYDPATDSYSFDWSIFIGMFIGFSSLAVMGFLVFREWRKNRRRAAAGG